jgi:hypothetical protein
MWETSTFDASFHARLNVAPAHIFWASAGAAGTAILAEITHEPQRYASFPT